MSQILTDLIEQSKLDDENYENYLNELVELAKMVDNPQSGSTYPNSINSQALAALYDNLGKDEELAQQVNEAIINSKKDNWKNHRVKRLRVRNAIKKVLGDDDDLVDFILNIAGEQSDY